MSFPLVYLNLRARTRDFGLTRFHQVRGNQRIHVQDDADQDAEEETKNRIAGNLTERHRGFVLRDIAEGKAPDPKLIQFRAERVLKAEGKSAEDASRLAPQIAASVIDSIKGKVRDRRQEEGTSNKEAAFRELAKDASKNRGTGGFSDLQGAYHSLQAANYNKTPYEQAIAASTRESNETLKKQYAQALAARSDGKSAMLVGPP